MESGMDVDYKFYIEEYKGSAIPDGAAFDSLVLQAAALVDSMIANSELLQYEVPQYRYRLAICSAAEKRYIQQSNDEGRIASESVGNHSVSYITKSAGELESECKQAARRYLIHTGLLCKVLL